MGCAKHGQGTGGCRTRGCDCTVGGAKSGHREGGGGHGAEEPRDCTQRGGVRTVKPGRGESSGIAVNTGDQRGDDGNLAERRLQSLQCIRHDWREATLLMPLHYVQTIGMPNLTT